MANDNLKEAVELLRQGKKVTRSNWYKNEYAYLNVTNGQVIDEKSQIVGHSLNDFECFYTKLSNNGDIETFSEYNDPAITVCKKYTAKEAVELLKQGKSIGRDNWNTDEYAYLDVFDGKVKIEDGKILSKSLQAFEKSYTHNTFMFFEYVGPTNAPVQKDKTYTSDEAIELLKQGKKITSENWTNKKNYLYASNGKIFTQDGYETVVSFGTFTFYYHLHSWLEYKVSTETKETKEPICAKVEEPPQPCSRCGFPDHWNSKGKDGKWYCYKHCM